MCVAAIAWKAHPRWRLVVAGNRDEYHDRPAAPLHRWEDMPGIIAGRDLTGGGTWLGVHEHGRFALVTNFRQPEGPQPGRPSRWKLITDLLGGLAPAEMARMNTFNVVHSSGDDASYLTNFPHLQENNLRSGVHGLSNGGFHDRWPKTRAVEQAITGWLAHGGHSPDALLDSLRDETPLEGPGPEPRFSPVFIRDETYGTRCSTVVTVDATGRGLIVERRFDPAGANVGETRLDFAWPSP